MRAAKSHEHLQPNDPPLRIIYRNYRGEISERAIVPINVYFGATEYHPEPQWLMHALDVAKGETRDFALRDFQKILT